MMNRKSKLLSLLLALCILAAVFPALPSAMAADGETAAPPASAVTYEDVLAGLADPYDYFGPLDENSVPAAVGYENAVERLHVARMYDEEGDSLHNVIFKNADGSRTQYLFDYPVKYVTETGEIADIRLDVVRDAQTAGAFRTAANSVVTTFSPYLSDGILLQSGGVSLRLIPVGASPAPSASSAFSAAPAAQRLDAGTVAYAVDDKTDYEYTLTYTGFKEDIVVSEYTGQTEYTFTLLTNGLTLTQRDGSYYLTDDGGAVKATIGDILIFTADERNNALGTLTHETVRDKQAYTLTIHLDDEYLRDENTAYPIRIDPTIEITSAAGAIEDVTLNSLSGSDGDSWSLTIGKRATYGVSRVLMKFPGLDISSLPPAEFITNATVEIRDLMCEDESLAVYCHVFTGNSWTENTANWNNVDVDNYGLLLSSKTVSYNNGAALPTPHRYSFNILDAVQGWKNNTYNIDKGILFKAFSTIENGTTYIKKTFSSFNRSTYKPSLSITYDSGIKSNIYYSKYDPSKFNNTGAEPVYGSLTDHIQYRMNCYGYAFGHILHGAAMYLGNGGYKQQPGEFAKTDDKDEAVINIVEDDPSASMNNVVANMRLDANRLGYMLNEYVPTTATVAQYGTVGRLIAVVTGLKDYHFYMQHNDGTWSHKRGSGPVTNKSIASNVTLTNANIRTRANEDAYANGELRFFVITRPATWDYPHAYHCCLDWPCSHAQSTLYYLDIAGDYFQTASTMTSGSKSARIDYAKDNDVYRFVPSTSKTYTITTTCSSGADLNCKIYDAYGSLLTQNVSVGQVDITLTLQAGKTYYFDVDNYSKTVTDYTITIS